MSNTGKKPRTWGSRRQEEKQKRYDREGTFLSKTTGKMKKPLTEGKEAAGGTGLG